MYYFLEVSQGMPGEDSVRCILKHLADGGVQSFVDTPSNDGFERRAYLSWIEEGNQPEPWPVEVGE